MSNESNEACECRHWAREPLNMNTAGTHHERCPNRPKTPWDRANDVVNELIAPTPHFRDSRQVIADAIQAAVDAALSSDRQWPTVAPFAAAMRRELTANAHKGHWRGADEADMFSEVVYHVGKLHDALILGQGDPLEYAADVANLCMMLVDNRGLLFPKEAADDGR